MIDQPTGPVRVLLSYAYYRDQDVRALHAKLAADGPPTIIADSGAFTAYTLGDVITPHAYAAWLNEHRDLFDYAITLDVLGDPEASWRSHRATEDAYGGRLVPVVHYGEPVSEIERYVAQGHQLIALGGLAIVGRRNAGSRMRWLLAAFRYAAANGVRYHGLGIGAPVLVEDLPWWSVDTTSWLNVRFGRTHLFDPTRPRVMVKVSRSTRDAYQPANARLLRDTGIDPRLLADDFHWTHSAAVSAWSYRRLEAWCRQRWAAYGPPISPPDDPAFVCRTDDPTGLRLHLVSSPPLLEYATEAAMNELRIRTTTTIGGTAP